jgi:hypothetical protein
MGKRTFTLRLDDEILDKLHMVAEANSRSVNSQIEFLVKRCLAEFEKENGKILLSDEE